MDDDYYELECEDCGWSGHSSELVCSDEDDKSGKPPSEIKFIYCPDCEGSNIVDID